MVNLFRVNFTEEEEAKSEEPANSDKKLYCETFVLNNDELDEFSFCKTRRMPYDYAVREVLKLAEKEGLVFNVSCDYPANDKIYSDEEYILGYVNLKD